MYIAEKYYYSFMSLHRGIQNSLRVVTNIIKLSKQWFYHTAVYRVLYREATIGYIGYIQSVCIATHN